MKTGFKPIRQENTEKFYIVALHVSELSNDKYLYSNIEFKKLVNEATKALESENIAPTCGKYIQSNNPKTSLPIDKDLKNLAIEFADGFGENDDMTSFIAGWNCAMNKVLTVLHENYSACKTLTDEDKTRSAQETVNETYEDLILIFMP